MRLRRDLAAALCVGGRPARLTLVRAGGLGDTVLLLPALALLRQLAPRLELCLVGSAWAEGLLPLIGVPLRLVRFDSPLLTPLFGPWAGGDPADAFAAADAAVIYASDPDGELVRNAGRLCPGPVIAWPVDPPPGAPAAVHFAGALTDGPPAPEELPSPPLRVPRGLRQWARGLLNGALGPGARPVAVHPGSGGARKCWPAEQFADLVRALARPALLLCGPADAEACGRVCALLPGGARPAVLSGLSVPQMGAVISECGIYVGNDSGPTHLAAALGVGTVAVFGPTDPAAWAPLGRHVRVVRGEGGRPWPQAQAVLAACRSHPVAGEADLR